MAQASNHPEIRVLHVIPSTKESCPKCGSLPEDEGGGVMRAGSWDWGPLYLRCDDCEHEWGFC